MTKLSLSAVILAGGDSKRMGTNKAFLRLEGKNLIDHVFYKLYDLFSEIVIVTDRPDEFAYLSAKLTGDIFVQEEKNALRGIHAGLTASTNLSGFVVGCDMPFLSLSLIKYMSGFALDFDVVVPRVGEYNQPLFAFYNKTALNLITTRLENKRFKIVDLYQELKTKEIEEETIRYFDPHLLSFSNINTKEDFNRAKIQYGSHSSD
ncbi:MAG: molybdenum cofactor guanylyltransferase [Bacillota bacterium]|nr:molybdenum cofactor guanylyltransferase [Bacillota bacterium]